MDPRGQKRTLLSNEEDRLAERFKRIREAQRKAPDVITIDDDDDKPVTLGNIRDNTPPQSLVQNLEDEVVFLREKRAEIIDRNKAIRQNFERAIQDLDDPEIEEIDVGFDKYKDIEIEKAQKNLNQLKTLEQMIPPAHKRKESPRAVTEIIDEEGDVVRPPSVGFPRKETEKKPRKKQELELLGIDLEKVNHRYPAFMSDFQYLKPTTTQTVPTSYQERVVKALARQRAVVVTHPTGSGKTLTATLAAVSFLRQNPLNRVIFICTKSTRENIEKQMISTEPGGYGLDINLFNQWTNTGRITYSTITEQTQRVGEVCNNIMYIVDEVQNLKTEAEKESSDDGMEKGINFLRAMECAKHASKVLLLSATPIVNELREINNLVSLASGLDISEVRLSKIFHDNPEMFRTYIAGLFSFLTDEEEKILKEEKYPEKIEQYVPIVMSTGFYSAYTQLEDKGKKGLAKKGSLEFSNLEDNALFSFYNGFRTRANVFLELNPILNQKVRNVKDEDKVSDLIETLTDAEIAQIFPNALGEGNQVNLGGLINDIRTISPKTAIILEDIQDPTHKNDKYVIYSAFRQAGISLLQRICSWLDSKRMPGFKVVDITGKTSKEERERAVNSYNSWSRTLTPEENIRKNSMRLILISRAGGEGIDLKETSKVYLMEPQWNNSMTKQVEGRGVRANSHKNLPKQDRKCTVVHLILVKNDKEKDFIIKIGRDNSENKTLNEKDRKQSVTEIYETFLKKSKDFPSIDFWLTYYRFKKQLKLNEMINILKEVSLEKMTNNDSWKDISTEISNDYSKRQQQLQSVICKYLPGDSVGTNMRLRQVQKLFNLSNKDYESVSDKEDLNSYISKLGSLGQKYEDKLLADRKALLLNSTCKRDHAMQETEKVLKSDIKSYLATSKKKSKAAYLEHLEKVARLIERFSDLSGPQKTELKEQVGYKDKSEEKFIEEMTNLEQKIQLELQSQDEINQAISRARTLNDLTRIKRNIQTKKCVLDDTVIDKLRAFEELLDTNESKTENIATDFTKMCYVSKSQPPSPPSLSPDIFGQAPSIRLPGKKPRTAVVQSSADEIL